MGGGGDEVAVLGIDVGERVLHGAFDYGDGIGVMVSRAVPDDINAAEWLAAEVERWVEQWKPDLVSVDAPSGRGQDPRGRRGRLCEAQVVQYVDEGWRARNPRAAPGQLARFGIAATPNAMSTVLPPWMATGFAVYRALAEQGYPLAERSEALGTGHLAAIETYPDATYWLLAMAASAPAAPGVSSAAPLPRKRHARNAAIVAARLALLPDRVRRRLEIHPDFPKSPTAQIHYIDAVGAARTGKLALARQARCLQGRPGEGALWIPDLSAVETSADRQAGEAVPGGIIRSDPRVLGGEPTLRDTGISVGSLLEALAAGMAEQVLRDYPDLKTDDVKKALRYAAQVLHAERGVR